MHKEKHTRSRLAHSSMAIMAMSGITSICRARACECSAITVVDKLRISRAYATVKLDVILIYWSRKSLARGWFLPRQIDKLLIGLSIRCQHWLRVSANDVITLFIQCNISPGSLSDVICRMLCFITTNNSINGAKKLTRFLSFFRTMTTDATVHS